MSRFSACGSLVLLLLLGLWTRPVAGCDPVGWRETFNEEGLIAGTQRVAGGILVFAIHDDNSPLTLELQTARPGLKSLEAFVNDNQPILAINAGYFDPVNGQTTSWLSLDGTTWEDPSQNKRLTENKSLASYLPAILNRSELRALRCGQQRRYAIQFHNGTIPAGCRLEWAIGAGPQLYPALTAKEEAFVAYNAQGQLVRDPVGMFAPNARSAIGINADGTKVFIGMLGRTVDATGKLTGKGGTPQQLAKALAELGATQVLSLDGGTSSGIYVNGVYTYGKFNAKGQPEKRRLKTVLMIRPD